MSQPFTIHPGATSPGMTRPTTHTPPPIWPAGQTGLPASQHYTIPFNRKTITADAYSPFKLNHPPTVLKPPEEKAPEPLAHAPVEADTNAEKKKVGFLGYLFPVLTLVGTPLMFGAMVLGLASTKNKNLNFFQKFYKHNEVLMLASKLPKAEAKKTLLMKLGLRKAQKGEGVVVRNIRSLLLKNPSLERLSHNEEALKKMYHRGRMLIALGIIPKMIIGLRLGVSSQQPSILISKIMEMALAPLIWYGNGIATAFNALVGAVFTLGFANDMENRPFEKAEGKKPKPPRVYDMDRFVSVFKRDSGVPLLKRPIILTEELAKMLKFSIQDNWVAMKRVTDSLARARKGETNDLTSFHPGNAAPKSSLALFITYLATVPNMIVNFLPDTFKAKGAFDVASRVLSGISAFMSEFSFFTYASGGRNLFEKLPAVGTTMEVSGTILGYTQNTVTKALAIGVQQFAAAINSVFYAHRSKNGVDAT